MRASQENRGSRCEWISTLFPPFWVCVFLFGKKGEGEGEILAKRASDRFFFQTDRSYEDGRSPKSDVMDVGPR